MLITGHKGYIGSHLLQQLTVPADACDLKDGQDFQSIVDRDLDVVIHLAASVSVLDSFQKTDEYMENNCWKILRFLKNNRVKKFIFTSTGGALYGNAHQAQESQAAWTNCWSPYAQSKYMAEQVIRELCPDHVILRLANVYGGDYSVRGEASVHAHFQEDNPITVFGVGKVRDFVHVDMVCSAIQYALDSNVQGTYNIGSGKETSIMDLAVQFSGTRQVPISIQSERAGEVDYISLCTYKARSAGFSL